MALVEHRGPVTDTGAPAIFGESQDDSQTQYNSEQLMAKVIHDILDEKENNLKGLRTYLNSTSGKKEIKDFMATVAEKFWTQFQMDKIDQRTKNLYRRSISILPLAFKQIIRKEIVINNLLSNIEKTKSSKERCQQYLLSIKSVKSCIESALRTVNPPDELIIQTMEKIGSDFIMETFRKIENKLKQEITLRMMIIGKLGVGKSTLISIIEGYINSLQQTNSTERDISDNGRGTTEISSTMVRFGAITLFLDDTIGQGDPGKGFSHTDIWKKIVKFYRQLSSSGHTDVDTILFSIDLSSPRFDDTDKQSLENFFKEFKNSYPDSLDWWKRVILTLTKANLVKLKEFENGGGIPKYELKKYLKKNGLTSNQENKARYNAIYKEKFVFAIRKWNQIIKDRVFEKITNNTKSFDEGGQSLAAHFKALAKKYYPNIAEEEIDRIINDFNYVVTGKAEQIDEAESWDFKNCEVSPVPDIRALIDDRFDIDEFEGLDELISELTISENWFNDLINRIFVTTQSKNLQLTALKFNPPVIPTPPPTPDPTPDPLPIPRPRPDPTPDPTPKEPDPAPSLLTGQTIDVIGSAAASIIQDESENIIGSVVKVIGKAILKIASSIKDTVWGWLGWG